MAPYFIRNLIPRREARSGNSRPLLEALRSITWIQWAQFASGFESFPPTSLSLEGLATLSLDGLLGLATQSTFSAYR